MTLWDERVTAAARELADYHVTFDPRDREVVAMAERALAAADAVALSLNDLYGHFVVAMQRTGDTKKALGEILERAAGTYHPGGRRAPSEQAPVAPHADDAIERAASELALADGYNPNDVPSKYWAVVRDGYRHRAESAHDADVCGSVGGTVETRWPQISAKDPGIVRVNRGFATWWYEQK